jgi:subtilisin family serine protease
MAAARKSVTSARAKKSGADSSPKGSKGPVLPPRIFAQASPKSIGGLPLFAATGVDSTNVINFASEDHIIRDAAARLTAAGFEVLQLSRTTINIAGPARLYEQVFGTKLQAQERETRKSGGVVEGATYIESLDTDLPGFVATDSSPLSDVLEGVAIEQPVYFMAPNAFAPPKAYWHLDVPGDVSLGVNADRAHRGGITGKGVRVMMTDSGWEPHPFFVQRGYRFTATIAAPGAANPTVDENGHGTAESANIFSVAPDVDFQMVKLSFTNATAGFNAAVAQNPQIISNSWGSNVQFGPLSAANLALAAAVATAVANGIVVVFSAGNGQWGFPGQHPDVISAGGVFMNPDGSMRASDYASGFVSNVYSGRQSPDLCGLVGMQPRAAYIMLPLPARCSIDVGLAGGTHPAADETANNDGWAAISGTSAAAPQLAGVAALMKQACPGLSPATIRDIMRRTARDVTTGSSHTNTPATAGVGPDRSTGAGLVDAHRAVLAAKLRCLPIRPVVVPITPVQPITGPITPIQPITGPITPVQPITGPITPIQPITGPITPIQPIRPIAPIVLPIPTPAAPEPPGAAAMEGPQEHGVGLTAEDIEYLEQMIVDHGDDLGL